MLRDFLPQTVYVSERTAPGQAVRRAGRDIGQELKLQVLGAASSPGEPLFCS